MTLGIRGPDPRIERRGACERRLWVQGPEAVDSDGTKQGAAVDGRRRGEGCAAEGQVALLCRHHSGGWGVQRTGCCAAVRLLWPPLRPGALQLCVSGRRQAQGAFPGPPSPGGRLWSVWRATFD